MVVLAPILGLTNLIQLELQFSLITPSQKKKKRKKGTYDYYYTLHPITDTLSAAGLFFYTSLH